MSISLPNYVKIVLLSLFFINAISCESKVNNKNKYIIDRFELQFYNSNSKELIEVKKNTLISFLNPILIVFG